MAPNQMTRSVYKPNLTDEDLRNAADIAVRHSEG